MALPPPPASPLSDGSSKDPTYFDLEFEAEQVRWSKGGEDLPPALPAGGVTAPGRGDGEAPTAAIERAVVVEPGGGGALTVSVGEAEAGEWQGLAGAGEPLDRRFVYSAAGVVVELVAEGARLAAPPRPAPARPGLFDVEIYVETMRFVVNYIDASE